MVTGQQCIAGPVCKDCKLMARGFILLATNCVLSDTSHSLYQISFINLWSATTYNSDDKPTLYIRLTLIIFDIIYMYNLIRILTWPDIVCMQRLKRISVVYLRTDNVKL